MSNYNGTIISASEKEIDLIAGKRGDNKVEERQYEKRGIKKGFYAKDFKYNKTKNRMICPAGKELKPNGSLERRAGKINYKYIADIIIIIKFNI